MRRTRVIFLAIIGVALAIVAYALLTGNGVARVTGLVGSEKAPFFEDERVQKALRRHGLEVTVQKAGSREIATSFDLSQYDFAFVLMSDGQNNSGISPQDFRSAFQGLPPRTQQVKTFTVLFGDADRKEMEQIAELTGGRMFDATSESLSQIFEEIRGYQ